MITAQPNALAKSASDLQSAVTGRVIIRKLGLAEYEPTWRAMQVFNQARTLETRDEIWLVEHPPVFTLGLAGKP
jgi:lipoate-protein ligase B